MTTNYLCRFVLGVAAGLLVATARAEPAIIAQARAFIGDEAALTAVRSLRFVGTLVTTDPVDASKQTRAAVEIVFQKPAQQRITMYVRKATPAARHSMTTRPGNANKTRTTRVNGANRFSPLSR